MIKKIQLKQFEEDIETVMSRAIQLEEKQQLPKREWYMTLLVIFQELLYFCLLVELIAAAYFYLGSFPTYRVVAIIISSLVWVNIAVFVAKDKGKEEVLILQNDVKENVHIKSMLLSDTTTCLVAIKNAVQKKHPVHTPLHIHD